jgi:hypothetical protein
LHGRTISSTHYGLWHIPRCLLFYFRCSWLCPISHLNTKLYTRNCVKSSSSICEQVSIH